MTYSDELVLRVNEVFHDLEGGDYERRHPEIFADEIDRWRRIGERFLAGHAPGLRVLDFGCGTGFVARQIGCFLGENDRLVCADLSARMLDRCRETVDEAKLACPCEYVKLDGRTDDGSAGSFDVITVNSTLHHIPDLPGFLARADTWLASGGRMIVAHEPNPGFYTHRRLRFWSAWLGAMGSPRRTVGSILRTLRLIDVARLLLRPFGRGLRASRGLLDAVNAQLLEEGALEAPLTNDELTAIVDIHSPTAGGRRPDRGIDLPLLVASHLPSWGIEHFETYNHLGETATGRLARCCAARLARKYPDHGATFLAVLRKP